MKYLLDTMLVSEFVARKPAPTVLKWLEAVDDLDCHLSVLTIGEIQKGIRKSAEPAKRRRLEQWLQSDLRSRFAGRIIAIDEEISFCWGSIAGDAVRRGDVLPVVDSLIAATAITHDLTVVTRNVSHIERCGAKTLNPWIAK